MSIYDKPTKTLMLEFARDRLKAGTTIEKGEAVEWFSKHYPKIRSTTVQMHVEGMAVNSGVRRHHANIKPGSGHDLFFKVAPGKFRLWNPKTDPAPAYGNEPRKTLDQSNDKEEEIDEDSEDVASQTFAFERDLRNFLAKNLTVIEQGLTLFQDEEFTGVEFPVGGRFIDILAVDRKGNFVVIELKVSRGHERTIGQLLRYLGWVQKHLASGKNVRGVIVASEITEDLKLAASRIPDVALFEYEIAFKLHAVTQ